jgi:uncharacterized cupredoxin-like copper-binding protein
MLCLNLQARSKQMVINHKLRIYLIGVLMLALSMACSLITGRGNESPEKSPGTSKTGESAGSGTITVTLSEFDVTVEPPQPTAGEVTFIVRNEGHIPHDFRIIGNGVDDKTPMIEAGGTETLSVSLEQGTYDYECTVEGHAMLGMKGSFSVDAGPAN